MDFPNNPLFSDDGDENFMESDAEFDEDLQLQEALLLSYEISSQLRISDHILPSSSDDTLEIQETATESFCGICLESKGNHQMFITGSCFHSFCSDCISQYVVKSIQDSKARITCPGVNCKSILLLDDFRGLLAKEDIDLWEVALSKEVIHPLQKLYCPFCSEMFVVDDEGGDIRESECQFCNKLFCAKCGVPWHHGIGCEEYGKLGVDERSRDDLRMRELAKEQKWNQCPRCKIYVERTDGCPHMICRCKFEFCYLCGEEWREDHGGCQEN
ncbi:hypothetical protein SLA2020_199870 [Shorea laevis]